MNGSSQRAWGRAAAAALIVLVAGAAPRAALAACGDYVIFTGAGVNHPSSGSPMLDDAGRLPAAGLPAFPRPCRGPHCSGRPTTPSAPPAPVQIQHRPETPALPATSNAMFDRERSSWALEDIFPRPLEIVSSIFHPPRLCARSAA